jgi:hypothetical protein
VVGIKEGLEMNTILDVRVEDGKIVERSPYFSHRTINNQFYRGAKWFGRDYSTEDNVDMTGWTAEQIINYLDHTECPAFIGSFENGTVAKFNIDDNIFESMKTMLLEQNLIQELISSITIDAIVLLHMTA